MDRIAGAVVMFLGYLTIAILHLFEKLGVDMSAFDEALARLTAFTSAQAVSLKDAKQTITDQLTEIDKLVSEDAAQDQIDIADAVKAALDDAAAKLDAVTTNLEAPPVDQLPDQPPPITDPGPPQTPPSGEFPTTDVPVVPSGDPANVPPESVPTPTPVVDGGGPLDPSLPVTPVDETGNPVTDTPPVTETPPVIETPVPVDPATDPVPAGELPPQTPVVEVPADTTAPVEVPVDAPVVPAGDLPAATPVVAVTEGGTGQ